MQLFGRKVSVPRFLDWKCEYPQALIQTARGIRPLFPPPTLQARVRKKVENFSRSEAAVSVCTMGLIAYLPN